MTIEEYEKALAVARSNASVANQLVERLATENGVLKARVVELDDGSAALKNAEIERLRKRVDRLEAELTIAKGGSGTQAPGVA